MKLEIVSEDARGWIAVVKLPDGKEAIMIFTRKGFFRGGELHQSTQHDFVLHGALRWNYSKRSRKWLLNDWGDEGWVQRKGDAGRIAAFAPHIAEALEDTLYVEYLESSFEKTFVPELRKLVEERMKNGPSG